MEFTIKPMTMSWLSESPGDWVVTNSVWACICTGCGGSCKIYHNPSTLLAEISKWATDPAPVLQLSDGRKRKLAVQTPVDAEQCSQITPHLKRIPQEKVRSFDIRLQDAWQKVQSLQTRQQSSEYSDKGSNVKESQTLRHAHSTSTHDAPLWLQSLKIVEQPWSSRADSWSR